MNGKDETARDRAMSSIRSNIEEHGHHVYVVSGGACPKYLYSIGLRETLGFELIWAGAAYFTYGDAGYVLNRIAEQLKFKKQSVEDEFLIDGEAVYSLRDVNPTWPRELWLGALDYYDIDHVPVVQIVPEEKYQTLDIPNLSRNWDRESEPIWRWMNEKWEYPVPEASTAATNLDALKGKKITQAIRWEKDYWEIFAGSPSDVAKEDGRVLPLGTLMGIDESLEAVVHLEIEQGIWRDSEESDWNEWDLTEE